MKRHSLIAPFFALFVAHSTWFAISDPQSTRLCSESNCKYIPPLSPPKPINMTIQMESRTALLSVVKEIKKVSLVRVSRQSSFCYVSVFLSDRGEECAMKNQHIVLDKEEVLDTVNKGMCRVGKDCSRPDEDSECRQLSFYGGPCRDQTRNNVMKPQQPRTCEKQMTPMVHVCTLCWACQIEQYPYVPKLVSEAGEINMLLGLPGQKEIRLGIHEIGEVKELENGWYLHTSKADIGENFMDVGCLKEGSKSLCLTKTDGLGLPAGSVFEVSKTGEGSLNNYHIAIEGPFVGSEDVHTGKINSAATQADLINEVQSLQFESRQSRYNAMSISKTITELQGLINNMINSLTKTNPMLLGDIIGRPVVTSWEGEQTIRICGCAKPNTVSNKSECFGRYYFEQGSWMYRPQGGECQPRNRQVGKSINLFSMANISIEGMAYPTLHEIVEEIHQNDRGEVQDDGAFPKDQGASSDKPFIVVYIFSKLVEVVKSASPWMSLISILLWLNLILSRLRRQI